QPAQLEQVYHAVIDQHLACGDRNRRVVAGALATLGCGADRRQKSGPRAAARVGRTEQERESAFTARLERDLVLDEWLAGDGYEAETAADRTRCEADRNAR